MIYYNFIGDEELMAHPTVIGMFEGIIFYDIQDVIGAKHDIPLPDPVESALVTMLNINNATYCRTGIFPDETVMTAGEIALGTEFRKLAKVIKLKKYYDVTIKNAFSSLSTERETWERQKIEADAYTLDPLAVTPFLDTLSTARGITKAEVVTKILAKAELYALAVGNLLGEQYKHEDSISLCTTLLELDALILPTFCDFVLDEPVV